MSKRISCLALSLVLLLGVFAQQVTAMEDSSASEQQIVTADEIQIDTAEETTDSEERNDTSEETADQEENTNNSTGPCISVDGVTVENTNFFIHQQTTYVSLRSVIQAISPDANISWEGNHATVTANGLTITVYPDQCYFVANGRYLYLPYGVRSENGTLFLPIRTLAKALDAEVEWDAETGSINILSGSGAIVSGDEYYNTDDLYWLSHIIYAESGNQPLSGKISVGNVILNRVSNPVFPNTIYDVIYQKNQFTPVSTGSINKNPNVESVIAAKLCLDGAVVLSDALWFNRVGISCWASKNKSYIATIGAHSFYA